MKFKLDENLGVQFVSLVEREGHEVDTVLAEGLSGKPDSDIYERCNREGRALVTLDMDFSNPLRFPPAGTAGIVVLRPPKPSPRIMGGMLSAFLSTLSTRPLIGQLWIVEPGRIRIHRAD